MGWIGPAGGGGGAAHEPGQLGREVKQALPPMLRTWGHRAQMRMPCLARGSASERVSCTQPALAAA